MKIGSMEADFYHQCKQAGLKSLAELAQITGRSIRTLQEWHKTSPVFFKIVLDGAVVNRLA